LFYLGLFISGISPLPCRERGRERVEKTACYDSTPILTFPLRGGRDWFGAKGGFYITL
jgi:hypothetical protein